MQTSPQPWIKPHHTFPEIQNIIETSTLQGYFDLMGAFPCFIQHISFEWDEAHEHLHYKIDYITDNPTLTIPDLDQIMETKLHTIKRDLDDLQNVHDLKMEKYKTRIVDLESKVLSCEHAMKPHFTKYKESNH